METNEIFSGIKNSLNEGSLDKVTEFVEKGLADGIHYSQLLKKGLIEGMQSIGERFSKNELFVPEVLLSARAMNRALEILEPEINKGSSDNRRTIVLGTVKGDLHDIGKNLVAVFFRGCGYKVIDIGVDGDATSFVDSALTNKADVIGISALLTTTLPYIKKITTALRENSVPSKIIVGGAPLTQDLAMELGADGFAVDAASAVGEVERLISLV